MNAALSRRTAIAALATAPAFVGVFAGAARATATTDRSAWDHAFAAYEKAKRIADDYATNVYEPAHAAWTAGLPDSDKLIHWQEFPFRSLYAVAHEIDVGAEWQHFLPWKEKRGAAKG